ncbi:unnamed protein product [Vitrella brassicaformis CCMP3155]|uniref:Uncharacterized protein n=2 Tax=Vitrella brassicaformis TaxID=1169539 RepID=A0A0G4FKS8_VITBC|nr:unnamed protein product [Vitrella brassicaformis CCMP3155]|mmetsp:Transcript_12722/g.30345  ORF Transcript_12722/g.30345 Transcript_12722/m.30345 type:complete len:122 (+) Transcript_12722:115-480(+)|eukprot:CEM13967.1 unnamed protein product [Vitrella brassicaformis CCMP3155]
MSIVTSPHNGRAALLIPLLIPLDDSSRHDRAALPDLPEAKKPGWINFCALVVTHQLWYFVPLLFAVVPSSAVAWVGLSLAATCCIAACEWSYCKGMAVVAASCGAYFPPTARRRATRQATS